MIGHGSILRCPACLFEFSEAPDELLCLGCGKRFPIRDGMADLRVKGKDYYFNPVSRPKMAEIIRDVSAESWPRTVRRFLAEVNLNRDWLDDLVGDGRYAWKLFLGATRDARVLDLGCGLGNLTKNLAPHVGEITALDLTWESLEFARRRFAVFNRNDRIALVAGGDGEHLPFADGTFDCVMMSGVLEWVADDSPSWDSAPSKLSPVWRMLMAHVGSSNPRRVQLRLLREVRRALKPSGELFIAIENRLGYGYLAGQPDHYCGLRYASLLPRALATVYTMLKSRHPYRTYTYSYLGYERLITEAGFARCGFLGLTPGISHLSELIPYDDRGGRWLPRHPADWKERVRASKLFVPGLGIVASAAQVVNGTSLVERIAREIEGGAGEANARLRLSGLKITGKAKAVAKGTLGERAVVLRIALNQQAAISEQANHDALTRIAKDGGALARMTPAPIAAGNVQGVRYCVEEEVKGTAMDQELRRSETGGYLSQVGQLLREMNPGLTARSSVSLEMEEFAREVDEPLDRLGAAIEDEGLIATAREIMAALLLGTPVRYGLTHGDLNPENVLVAGGKITGVVDWEDWSPRGLPILDVINFVEGALRILNPSMGIADSVLALTGEGSLPPEYQNFLGGQYRALGFDFGRNRGFVYLYWLQHVHRQLDSGLVFDASALENRVRRVLLQIGGVRREALGKP
jgi:SAM-dependent methyltransferase